jgi:hypothetical protein
VISAAYTLAINKTPAKPKMAFFVDLYILLLLPRFDVQDYFTEALATKAMNEKWTLE